MLCGPATPWRAGHRARPWSTSTIGAVFSIKGFTEPATALIQMLPPVDVLLWEGDEIDRALRKRRLREGMRRKLRHAVEHGFADLNLMDLRDFA
jgi:hypothetical protein